MKIKTFLLWTLVLSASLMLPGFAAAVVSTWILFILIRRATPERDRGTLTGLLSAALLMRLALFIILQYLVFSRGMTDIFGDARDNIIQGTIFADYFRGEFDIGRVLSVDRYNTHSMSVFNGLYFLIFGRDIIFLKYINMLAMLAAGWLIYDFLRRTYSATAGLTACAIVLFWPTLVFWSITGLKEAHLIFCLAAIFWVIRRLAEGLRWTEKLLYLLALAACTGYTVLLKYKMMFPILFLELVLLACYYILRSRRTARARGRLVFFASVLFAAGVLTFHGLVFQKLKDLYGVVFSYYVGSLNTLGWNYVIVPPDSSQMYNPAFIVKYFAGAWLHFLAEPFPWHMYSPSLLSTVPEMAVWYMLLLFSAAGLIKLKRRGKIADFVPMLIFFVLYVSSLGMSVANIGTVIRFRDAVMPITAILAACAFFEPSGRTADGD